MKKLIRNIAALILLSALSGLSIAETATLEGSINLPAQTSASVEYDVNVCQFINFSEETNCSTQRVTILGGSSSVNFSLVYSQIEPDRYTVFIECVSDCDEQILGRVYLQAASAISVSFSSIQLSTITEPLAFNLPEIGIFETTIALPNGQTALQDMQFEMRICASDIDFRPLGCLRKAGGFVQDQSSVNFLAPHVLDGYRYTIELDCFTSCSPYLSGRRYLKLNFETLQNSFQSLPADVFASQRTITLTEGVPIRSLIRLPNGEIAANDIVISNTVCAGFFCKTVSTILPAQSNSVLFESVIPFDSQQQGYRWSSRCSTGCGKYVDATQRLGSDGRFSFGEDTQAITQENLPTQVDIELVEGRSLTGRIFRPVGDLADDELAVNLLFCSDRNCRQEIVEIAAGESSSEFLTSVLPSEPGGSYQLSYRCVLGCKEALTNTIYINQNLEPIFDEIRVSDTNLPSSIDLTLQTGFVVRGSVSLPAGLLAQRDLISSSRICSYDSSGQALGCSAFSQGTATIRAGDSSVNYSVSVRPAPIDGSYRFETQCLTSCNSFVEDVRYLTSSLELDYNFSNGGIDAGLMPQQFDFTLDQGQLIQGSVSLADFQSSQVTPFSYRIRVCSFTAQKSLINCASSFNQSIDFNSGSGSFVRAIRPAPDDGFYQISAACSDDCGLYLPNTQYFSLDTATSFIPTDIPAQLLPSNINFELSRGRVVSGSVTLPGAEVVSDDVRILVQFCSFTNFNDTAPLSCSSRFLTIEQGNTAVNFQTSAVEAPPEGAYRISASCADVVSDCGLIINDGIYLNSNLDQTFESSLIPSAALPGQVDFELSRGVVLDVDVNLPAGEVATNTISNNINICAYSSEGAQLSCSFSTSTIANDESSTSKSVSVRPAPIGGYYRVFSSCQSGCDSFLSAPQYLKENGESSFVVAQVGAAVLPTSASFTLSRGTVLIGSVTLPNGDVANEDISSVVRLCSYEADQFESNLSRACSSINVTIEAGQNTVDYQIGVVPAPDDGDYEVSVSCLQGCSNYIGDQLYLTEQHAFSFDRSSVSAGTLPSSVNFTLDSGRSIGGQLLLPDASQAESDMQFSISLCVYEPGQNFSSRCAIRSITISSGSSFAAFSVAVRPGAQNSFYGLSVRCEINCGIFLTDTLYLQSDGSFSFEEARVSEALLPTEQDIAIQRGREVRGLVKLPGNLVAEQKISVQVRLCTATSTSFSDNCRSVFREIEVGESEVDYGVSIRPVVDDGFYTLSISCNSNCGLFLRSEAYLAANSDVQFSRQSLTSSQLPATVDLSLDQGRVINVSIVTPSGELAEVDIQNRAEICSFDSVGRAIACSDFTRSTEINQGDSSSMLQLSVIEAPVDGFYTLSTSCTNNCGVYLSDSRFLQTDFSIGYDREFIPASVLPNSVVLPLDAGQVFNFTLALPDGAQAPTDIYNSYQFCSFNSGGGSLDCSQSFGNVSIQQGENRVSTQVSIRPAPVGGFYSFATNCDRNCGIYLRDRQYLQADLGNASEVARVPAAVFPSSATFTLPSDINVSGQVLIPQNGITGSTLNPIVELCTYDASDRRISCISETLTIEPGSSSANYVLSTKSAPSGGGYRLSLHCFFSCGPFLPDRQFLKSDLSTTFEFSDALLPSAPESYDFMLSTGQALVGALALPGEDVADKRISNSVEICVYRSSGEFLSCRSNTVDIASGSDSAEYQLNIRPAPPGGFYRISTRCSDGCGQYLTDQRFLQDDGSLDFESFDIQAADLGERIDLQLELGKQINGVLRLPNAEVADETIQSSFRICSLDSNGSTLSCKDQSVEVGVGFSEQGFSTSLRPAPPNGFYQVSTRCSINCGLFLDSTRYLNQNLEFDFEQANVLSSDLPDLIDISLTKGFVLSGNLSLPQQQIAQSDIDVLVRLCSIDENGFQIDCEVIISEIKQGESDASYLLSTRPASENGFYQLSTSCYSNCGNSYLTDTRYLQLDGSFGFESARVPLESIIGSVDIELDQGKVISGTIRLPTGELAERNIFQSVEVCSYDASRSFLACVSSSPVINQGDSEVSFNLNIRPAPEGGYYTVSSRCGSSCGSFLNDIQYLASNLEVKFSQQGFNALDRFVSSSLVPDRIDFELSSGAQFIVQVVNPSELSSLSTSESSVEICVFDSNQQFLRCESTSVRVPASERLGSSTINILAAPSDGFYRVSSRCVGGCDDFLSAQRYLALDGMTSTNETLIPAAQISSDITFALAPGFRVSGRVALAGLEPSTSNLFINVMFCSMSSAGQQIECANDRAFIFAGDVSGSYSTSKIAKQSDHSTYQISISCAPNCGEFQQQVHYLNANGKTQLTPAFLSFSELPDRADLTLLRIATDRYESDDQPRFAKPIVVGESQARSLHLVSDEDWVEFSLEQGGSIEIEAVSNDLNSRLALDLYNQDLTIIESADFSNQIDGSSQTKLDLEELPAGFYFIRVSPGTSNLSVSDYTLRVIDVRSESANDDQLCIPIKAASGNISIVCL